MAEHPNESLPGFAFLFPQGPAQIGQNEQFMGQTTFAEVAFAHAPAAAAAGKCQGERRVFIGVEANRQAEITRPAAEQFVDRLAKQIFACAINQTEPSIGIEGEDRDFDLGHDRAEQRGCFEGAQPLHAQRLAELIDLEQDFAERVLGPRAAGADRVIAFAQGREQIAHRLERTHAVFPGAGKESRARKSR